MISNGALTLLKYRDQISRSNIQSVIHAGLSIAYGMRLTEFLYRRKSKSSYKRKMKETFGKSAKGSFSKRLNVVIMVTILMSLYIIPLNYSFKNGEIEGLKQNWVSWLGSGLSAFGIIVQFFADEQKLKHKETIGGCIMNGIYKWIRHPNYAGEALFHVGMYFGGFCAYKNWFQMIFAGIAPALLTFVIVGATARLDKKQMETYGKDPVYKRWKERSWSLFPFVF